MMFIARWLYYACVNLVYYRHSRPITHEQLAIFESSQDPRTAFTNMCLATVGLKIVNDDSDVVPWYIPLSNAQISWIDTVSEHGYKVGLI